MRSTRGGFTLVDYRPERRPPPSWGQPTPIFMRRSACIPASPAGPPRTSRLRSLRCSKATCQVLPSSATFQRFRGTVRLSRPSSFMGIATPPCIRATAIMSSRSLRGPRTCRRKCIAVGYPEDIPILVLSIPTRAAGQSLNNGRSMEPDTLGREAALLAPTPIRWRQTPRERCCASSSSTPPSRGESRQSFEAQGLVKKRAGIMAKIEKPAALACIEDVVTLVDAVMVARGDLGVEIPPEDVPGTQKELVRLCRRVGKPVVVATQMLESMIQTPSPTRAEASDVATAIYDSADAVMLSAESASGQFPVEAVAMMDRIISHTEGHKLYRSIIDALQPAPEGSIPHAVAAAEADVADQIGAAAIVAFTASETTALRVARKRPKVPIVSLSPEAGTARQLALLWGAHSMVAEDIASYDEMVDRARTQVLSQGAAKQGDSIVIIAGVPFGRPGTTNNLRVIRL